MGGGQWKAMRMAMTRRAALAAVGGWGRARAEEWGEQVDLWRRGEGGVHTYRIPALIETRGGALLGDCRCAP